MKLTKLKNKLVEKRVLQNGTEKVRKIKVPVKLENKKNLDDMKIIGITGSRGKSTTAVIVHESLKALGYKSVLYSSATVDSPASHIRKNEAFEIAVRSEESLLSIINEAEAYGADFLVLEVNESTLSKEFLDDISFNVRALTNLNPKHNLEQYTENEYVKLKKSFFENIDDDCKCVIGFQDYDKELYEELLALNECEKLIFTSNYIATVKKINTSQVTCLLYELESGLSGLKMKVLLNGVSHKLETNLTMSYNALNIACAMTILEALNIFEPKKFSEEIKDITVPGRAEVKNVNQRTVIIDPHLPKMLECLQTFKTRGEIKKIKVVIGSMGHGYKNWEERFKNEKFIASRIKARKFSMDLLKEYADYVYLTESDNGAGNVLEICLELQNNLNGTVPSVIIEDRETAIKQAIEESEEGDVIFVCGRGNRRLSCNTATTMKVVKDSEVVEKVLKELKWN